jgi:hypothetical protein
MIVSHHLGGGTLQPIRLSRRRHGSWYRIVRPPIRALFSPPPPGGDGNDSGNSTAESPSRSIGQDRRLLSRILSIPLQLDTYFGQYPRTRQTLWCGISAGAGFYAGNIVTLSFGALAINDVFAGVVTLLFYEIVSRLFYGATRPSLKLWFANWFKLGVVLSMLADAIKLGG